MKNLLKALPIVLSLVLVSCGTETNSISNIQDSSLVQAQASKKTKLSMNKENTKETLKSNSELKGKLSKGDTKKVEQLNISFTEPMARNDLDPKNYGVVARIALKSMNGAKTFESGYKVARATLDRLNSENVYIAKLAIEMANAGMYWETNFKVAALALENISIEKENNINETCDFISKSMSSTKSYEEGAKLGYAAFNVVGKTDNQSVKILVDTIVSSAKQGRYWEDVYKTLQNGISELNRI